MTAHHLALVPRDGYFFKDGRGWSGGGAGGGGRGTALEWPYPTTLRGALRTAYGFACLDREQRPFTPEDWRARTQGLSLSAVVALRRRFGPSTWQPAHRVWPAPADALCVEGQAHVRWLRPRALPAGVRTLGRDDDPAREALALPWLPEGTGKPEPTPRWWSEADFALWLAGQTVRKAAQDERLSLPSRLEVHLALQPATQTAEESMLFTTPRTETLTGRPAHEWGLGLRACLPPDFAAREVPLGADRRPAWVEKIAPELFDPPAALETSWSAPSAGLRLVVVTPGEFDGWRLPGFTARGREYRGTLPGLAGDFVLRAACVPRSVSVSGWDMARGRPKPLRRLVPAGAVYFLARASSGGVSFEEARKLWLAQLGAGREDGLGCVVPGRWDPEAGS